MSRLTQAPLIRAATLAILIPLGSITFECRAQSDLDTLGNRLTRVSADGQRWARLSAMSDLAIYAAEDPPPGLLFSDAEPVVAPRVSVTADAGLGTRLLAHVRLRADRGFDPGADDNGDLRFDEYFVEANLIGNGDLRLRAGKFATAFGGWVSRHLAWDNPLITAPAIYDDLVTITDAAAPADVAAFATRRDAAENKATWVPVVWGPSYATGAALSGGVASVDVTLEIKNAALSSRPDVWDPWDHGFTTDPTVTGRAGWHPRPEWTLGVSFSHGPYLQEGAEQSLPGGTGVNDFDQTTWGLDLTYERHHLQVWGELVGSRFDVPRVGAVDMLGGFLELRYKLAPRFWIAGRWNQSWFDDLPGLDDTLDDTLDDSWDRDLRRAELALGYRHSAHLQAKVEYGIGDQAGGNTNGNHRAAAQLVVWF